MRWRGMTFERSRVVPVVVSLALVVIGWALPYLTLTYVDKSSQTVTGTERLGGASALVSSVDPTYLTNFGDVDPSSMNVALNLAAVGPGLQQVFSVALVLTSVALLFDEINKILWWGLHLSGYPLVLAVVPLLIGVSMLGGAGVPVTLGPGFVPVTLAGLLMLVVSWRARRRLDADTRF